MAVPKAPPTKGTGPASGHAQVPGVFRPGSSPGNTQRRTPGTPGPADKPAMPPMSPGKCDC